MTSSVLSLRLAGAVFLLLASAPVAASNDSDRAPAAQNDARSDGAADGATPASKSGTKERRICRRLDDTGSNVQARKLCLTPAQWKARNKR